MRILALRGENLASLAGAFAVDFTSGPLSQGLFAISGPTGAGKSTLLDALCLALYHTTPRLVEPSDALAQVPDGVAELPARDARHLIRRGTAEGFAEVDFVGGDGVAWRARWQAHRARRRSSGQFQNATASLQRCDGSATFAGTISEVRDEIARLVGLSFAQFRRSVLLAQNDFAALLKARHDERALLLEALTTGEVFSNISRRVHERHKQELTLLDQLVAGRAEVQILTDDERLRLLSEVDTGRSTLDALHTRESSLRSSLQWLDEGDRRAAAVTAAASTYETLARALADDAAHKKTLDRAVRLRPGVGAWRALAEVRHTLAAAEHELPGIVLRDEELARTVAAATFAVDDADQAVRKAAEVRASAQTAIATARAADLEVRTRRAEHAARTAARDVHRTQLLELEQRIARAHAEIDVHAAVEAAWAHFRAQHPGLAADDDGAAWAALGRALDDHAEAMHDAARLRAEIAQKIAERQARQDDVDAAAQDRVTATALWTSTAAALAAAETALETHDVGALEDDVTQLGAREAALQACMRAVSSWSDAAARVRTATLAIDERRTALSASAHEVDTAAGALALATAAFESARTTLARTKLAADEVTVALRATLVPGEPCLVCGATDHPAAHDEPVLAGVLTSLTTAAARAQAAHTHAVHAHAAACAAHDAGRQTLLDAERVAQAANDEELTRRVERDTALLALGIVPDSEISAALSASGESLARDRDLLAARRRALQEARTAVDDAQRAQKAAQRAVDAARVVVDDARARLEPLVTGLAVLAERLTAAEERRAAARAQIDDHVAHPDVVVDADVVDGKLRAVWRAGATLQESSLRAREPLVKLRALLGELDERRTVLREQRALADAAVDDAARTLGEAIAARRAALHADDVDAFAVALDDEERAAQAVLGDRVRTQDDARARLSEARAARMQAETVLGHLRIHVEERRAALAQMLQEAGEDELVAALATETATARVAEALATIPDDLDDAIATWQAREIAVGEQRARVDALQTELTAWSAQPGTTSTRAELGSQLAAVIEQTKSVQDAWTAAQGRLLVDDDARRRLAARDEAVVAQRRALGRWEILHDLIGSSDGKKFRVIAQQLSLEVLLDVANQHLESLAPRYRLLPGLEPLSLLVVDHDCADERRSVHSLSGGETFLVSLGLALGLSSLSAARVRVESLFIDEGFGSLDGDTLQVAMATLDRLQSEGRRIGVISHVPEMAERIGPQIRVHKHPGGHSTLEVTGL